MNAYIAHRISFRDFSVLPLLIIMALTTACGGGGGGGGGGPTTKYVVKINATGIKASGFNLKLIATDNTQQTLTIAADGEYSFGTALSDALLYSVSINTHPTGQTCLLGNNKIGTVNGSDIIIVATCSDNSTNPTGISVRVDLGAALSGTETLTLTLNGTGIGTETKTFTKPSLDIASFATLLNNGDAYVVAMQTPPSGKRCNLEGATGVVAGGASPLITITCVANSTPTYTVGGTITGLNGAGLQLKLNSSETLAINIGMASYTFSTALLSNSWFTATVDKHPLGQICTISNSSQYISNANITNVNVICSNGPHVISGAVTGLKGTGLVLLLNGVENLSISNSGVFSFPTALSNGMNYDITVKTAPAGQTCTVYRGSGTGITSSISNILVGCADKVYEIGSRSSGYNSTTPLSLLLNGKYQLDFTDNWIYSTNDFNTYLKDGEAYNVTILAQPYGQICTLTNPSGTVQGANVTNISASCASQATTTGPYSVSVTTTGLLGSGLTLQLNNTSSFSVTADGYSTFPTLLNNSASYSVSVLSQPGIPLQKCNVVNGNGTIAGKNITNVGIVCGNAATALFPINGARWLDYVKNASGSALTSTALASLPDTACNPSVDNTDIGACLNGGVYRVVKVDNLTSCTGITAADNLNGFNWLCDNSTGKVRIISNGLKSGVLLSDLMDFDKTEFKSNFVTISNGGSPITTQPAIWWTNTVQTNNTGEYQCCGGNNTIVLVSDNVPSFYKMDSKSALLIRPGFAISGYAGGGSSIVTHFSSGSSIPYDYLWIEGKINSVSPSISSGISLLSRFAVLQGVEVSNTGGVGVLVSGSNTTIRGLVSKNNTGNGIHLWGSTNLDASTLTATGNLGTSAAIDVDAYSGKSRISNVVASDNPYAVAGLRVKLLQSALIENVVANNNGVDGLNLGVSNTSFIGRNNTLRNISASGNGNMGIYVLNASDSTVSGLTANNNGLHGIKLDSSDNSPVSDVVTSGNGKTGTYLFRWSSTTFDNLSASNNGEHGLLVSQTSTLKTSNVSSHNNAIDGFYLDSNDDNVWFNLTASNNAGVGVNNYGNSTGMSFNVFMGVTTVNNGSHGIVNTRLDGFHYSSLLSAQNGGDGMNNKTFVDGQVYSNMVSANNAGYGINMDSDLDYYTGVLRVGTNSLGNCLVDTLNSTAPGLVQGRRNTDCISNGLTDATITQGINLATSLKGIISTEDTVNTSDSLGAALYQNISDWTNFEHSYRAWGKDGIRGRCILTGENCRIWDWSTSLADTGMGGLPAILNVLPLPTTGNEMLTVAWTPNVTYLRNAVEISKDSIGNDNYLCESGETCLYTPNIGSYQGHGVLIPAGSIGTTGTLKSITLVRYDLNGR